MKTSLIKNKIKNNEKKTERKNIFHSRSDDSREIIEGYALDITTSRRHLKNSSFYRV